MLHFSLSLINRLNKTGSAIFILYFGLVALEGSTFHQNFSEWAGRKAHQKCIYMFERTWPWLVFAIW